MKDNLRQEEKNQERRGKRKQELLKTLYFVLGLVLLAAVWEILHFTLGKSSGVFPEFFVALGSMFSLMQEGKTWVNYGYSLLRLTEALGISLLLGYILGLLAAFFSPLETVLSPLIYILTALPTVSIIFLLVIYTKSTSMILATLISFPLIYQAVLSGGKNITLCYSDSLRLEGKHKSHVLFSIYLPLDLPYLALGFMQAFPLALKSELMGEVFMSTMNFQGLGHLIHLAYLDLDIERLFGLTLFALLMSLTVDLVFRLLKFFLCRKTGLEEGKSPYHLI